MLKRAGRYEILAELGRGGFGQVYRAVDPTLDSMVAIKTLSVDNDASILARFRNEAAASRRLRHPNIVTIYDFGEQDGTPFIVMELLEGQDLQRVIESRKPLPLWHKVQLMTQVASGLANAHAHGIVHRDVKPANIMLLPDGNVKIMDFGIALVSQDTQNRLTPRGAVIGTFRYMAPEQFRGSQQDARGDIFAFGLMFYELLTGIHPFHAPEPAAAMYNMLNLEPVPIRELCPECPQELEVVIARLLQKDPEFRYQNLEDVLFDCEPVLLDLKRAQARDLFEKVTLARGNAQLETAQTLLRQVMELDPAYPGARELREQLQAELRRSAVRPRVEALAAEAREQLGAGNPAEALQKFEAAIRLDPSDYTLKSWLEQAKGALEQSRQVARLVAEAERALESGDLTGAHRIARQAVELAPAAKRAREIVARTGATLAELERQTRLAAELARVRRLIEINSWDESSSLLDQLELEFPRLGEIGALREMLETGRLAEQRQQKLSTGLAAARQEIQGRSLQAASSRLAALQSEFPNATDVQQLLRYVTSELEADRQRDVIDRSLSESRALSERNRFADAAKILETALASYPAHPLLQRELRSVTIALHQAERDAALNQALSSAKELQAHGNFEQALESVELFTSKYGSEPAIEELRRNIERDREAGRRAAELRKMVLHINDLLSQDKAEEATLLLQTFPTPLKNAPEMTQLRMAAQAQLDQKNERRAALDQALSGAADRRQQNDFDQALQFLAAFTARYGADPKIAELDKSIRQDWAESQHRAEERRGLVKRANQFLAQGKAAEATQLLQSRPAYLRDDSEVTKILEAADFQARQLAEREAALQAAISSAVSSQKQGRFDEALALLDGFTRQYGPQDRVTALQQAIETDRVAEQAQLDQKNERRAALDQALSGAADRRQQNDFDQALQILAAFTARYGADPKIAELDKSIRRDWAESQRRAAERQGLVKRANEFLAQGKAAEATQLLQSRPAYLKDDSEVTKILEAADLQVRSQAEREAAVQAAISSAVSSQEHGRFDEALARLDGFLRQYGPQDRVTALRQAIQTDREAARQAAEIRELETRARSLLDQNDLKAGIALLQQAPSLVKESQDLRELLSGAETALAAKQTREFVEATVAEARSKVGRGEYQVALAGINRGLQRFPLEAALTTARAEVLAAQAAKERGEYLARAISDVRSLIAKHEYSRALRLQEDALGKISGEPQLQALKAEIEAHQRDWEALQIEQKIQDTVRRARELLQGKPAESVALLEKLCAQNPNRPELITQLGEAREAQRQAGERQLIRESESLCQKNKFSEAIAKLGQADRQTPELEAARQRAESLWAAAVSERITKGIQSARSVAERKPAQALRDLEKLRQQFPGRPEIESVIEEYRQVLVAQERALEEARRAAAADLSTVVKASPAAEVRQLPEARQAQQATFSSRPRMVLAAALTLAALLAVSVWWIVHYRRVHPAITLVPLEVRTDPDGASVRIGDRSCVTPKCQLDLQPGTYNVEAQLKGYEPVQQNFQVTGTHPASLDLTLRPVPAPPPPASSAGRLIVQAGLADVLVIVDNLPRGRTDASGALSVPLEAKKTYTVRVEKPGYETGRDQLVRIGERATETVVFKVNAQTATLELRGAPAGVDLRAGGRLIGRTGGATFSAPVPPGDQVLRVTEGSASREIFQRFEPGKVVALDWASIAPNRTITPPAPAPPSPSPPKPNQPDPAEQAWISVSSASDPALVKNYLDSFPNSRHTADAQTLLESLTWSRVNQNDLTSLRDYLNRFRSGPHARDAARRVAELVWNGVNQKDEQGVRSFIEQNPDSPYRSQAQAILDQFEKQRSDAESRQKQERAKQDEAKRQLEEANKQNDAQRTQVLAVLDRFNTAFAQHKERDLKAMWPKVPQSYIEVLKTPSLLSFEGSQVVNITADAATVNSNLATKTVPPHPPQPVTLTLRKSGNDWVIVNLERR